MLWLSPSFLTQRQKSPSSDQRKVSKWIVGKCSSFVQWHFFENYSQKFFIGSTFISSGEQNVLEAASSGASASIGLVANIAVNLIAFLAILAFINSALGWLGGMVGYPTLTFEVCEFMLFLDAYSSKLTSFTVHVFSFHCIYYTFSPSGNMLLCVHACGLHDGNTV